MFLTSSPLLWLLDTPLLSKMQIWVSGKEYYQIHNVFFILSHEGEKKKDCKWCNTFLTKHENSFQREILPSEQKLKKMRICSVEEGGMGNYLAVQGH